MTPERALSGAEFRRRFRWLVFLTWSIPPFFGLGFILLIGVLTPAQVVGILTTPLEPIYILGWLAFAVWYLPRRMQPVIDCLDRRPGSRLEQAVQAVRSFPLAYWATFLVYLVLAPVSVIIAAEIYTGFIARPVDYFRIELVALIVSIIVGLPIFFLVFDLFGQALGGVALERPIFTIRTKVIVIGALVPLLIDTMLVQYYWTRTGFFSGETFAVWLLLEVLAVGGSLVFARSFGQALAPLRNFIGAGRSEAPASAAGLMARSTDELGALTADYRGLLTRLQLHGEILEINNQLLRRTGATEDVEAAFTAVVELCQQAIRCDQAFLIVLDPVADELVGVAQTADGYRADGHFRLRRDETSLAVWVFNHGQTAAVEDASRDPRVSPRMREHFGVSASLAAPLRLEGEAHGVLMVIDRQTRSYGEREIAMIEGLAREAALALHAHRLRQAQLQAEAERREQAELVKLLMDATEEGIFGVDKAGTCMFINRAAVRMLGYGRPEDLLGRSIHDLIHHTLPDGRPYPKEQCEVRLSTLKGLPTHANDEVHWRADGSSFPVEYWSHPVYRDGELAGAVVAFIDITERKRTEARLFETQHHFEALLAASPVGVFEADAAGAGIFVNARWCEMTGMTLEQARGDGWVRTLHPDDRAWVYSTSQAAVKEGRPFEVEHRLLLSGGRVAWVLAQAVPLRNETGEIAGLLGTVTDITERKRAESALRESEARHRLLFETMEVGVVYQSRDGRIEAANPAAEHILGLTLAQMQGRTSMDRRWRAIREDGTEFRGDEHPAMVALRTGQPVRDVVMGVFHPQDDAYRWISINAMPEFHEGEAAPYRVYTTFADMTARRQAEEKIRRINAELEARVARRTADLQAARDLAERANRAKSEFLSRMSHELRTPLNAVLGFAQALRLLGETVTPVQRDEYMAQIEKAGWHLLELINEVLDLSRIESGRMSVSREPVQLQRLCAECLQLVQPLTHAADITVIDGTTEVEPLAAFGDRTRLNQVLMNLLSNAVKYNRRGGVITVTLRAVDADWVELGVEDTGPGFTPEQLRHLYEPFNRLGAEVSATEGTGIGLVVTKRLAELMGGRLDLTTTEGVGSRFTVRLKRAPETGAASEPPLAPAAVASSPHARDTTVLYIEDNPSNVDVVRSALQLRPRAKLLEAPDGPTGLEIARQERPDLILVDIALPGIDGYEVCRRLRARAETATTPLIAVSANAMQADIDKGTQAGFDAYLTKPVDVRALLALVDRLLSAQDSDLRGGSDQRPGAG